jgi:hypothetical protein
MSLKVEEPDGSITRYHPPEKAKPRPGVKLDFSRLVSLTDVRVDGSGIGLRDDSGELLPLCDPLTYLEDVEHKDDFLRVSRNSGESVTLYRPPHLRVDNLKRVKQAHFDEKGFPISHYALSSICLDGGLRFFNARPEIKAMMAVQVRVTRLGAETPDQVRAILKPICEDFPINLPGPFRERKWGFYAPVQTFSVLQSTSAGLGATDTDLASLMICSTLANLPITYNTDTKKIIECIDLFLSQVQIRADIAEALLDRFEGVSYSSRAESWLTRFGI